MPSLIERLYQQDRELIRDSDSGKMRWRGERIDPDLAQLIRHQDEIVAYETMQVTFDEHDDDALRVACQTLIKCALRRMCELVGKTIDQTELDNVTKVLKQYWVDMRGLIPLKKFLTTKKQAQEFIGECGGRKIVRDTAEEYLVRLHKLINDQEDVRKSIDTLIPQEEGEALEFKSTLLWDINLGKRNQDVERGLQKQLQRS